MIFAHNSGGRLGEVLLALNSCRQKEEERYSLYRKRSTKGFYGFSKCWLGHSFQILDAWEGRLTYRRRFRKCLGILLRHSLEWCRNVCRNVLKEEKH